MCTEGQGEKLPHYVLNLRNATSTLRNYCTESPQIMKSVKVNRNLRAFFKALYLTLLIYYESNH